MMRTEQGSSEKVGVMRQTYRVMSGTGTRVQGTKE
jgi:hypothetical protein